MIYRFFSRHCTPVISLFAISLFFSACRQLDVFEKNTSIPQYEWSYAFQPSFDFEVTDTSSRYNIYIVLRHRDAYRYNNIWLNVGTRFPKDSTTNYQRFDLQLASEGKGWEGTGMDDIWEVRKPLTKGPVPLKIPGKYHFTLAQVMRENPLPNILSAGIRVEKVK